MNDLLLWLHVYNIDENNTRYDLTIDGKETNCVYIAIQNIFTAKTKLLL